MRCHSIDILINTCKTCQVNLSFETEGKPSFTFVSHTRRRTQWTRNLACDLPCVHVSHDRVNRYERQEIAGRDNMRCCELAGAKLKIEGYHFQAYKHPCNSFKQLLSEAWQPSEHADGVRWTLRAFDKVAAQYGRPF